MHPLDANETDGRDAPSWYAATAHPRPEAPPLVGDVEAEVCVIGGGYTGLSAALHLAEAGRDVVLIEAQRVGWGASGRNGGQIGSGQRLDVLTLEETLGPEAARALWDLGEDAKALVYQLIERLGIDCDLRPGVIHADHRARFGAHSKALVDALSQRYGYADCSYLDRAELAEKVGVADYHGGVLDRGAGHCHPLNYAIGLARGAAAAGARLHERSRVRALEDDGAATRVMTDHGSVRAGTVLLGCNGYLGDLSGAVARHVRPINNFILATEPLGETRARALIRDGEAVADSRFVVNYYRLSPDHRLLFGGGESYGLRFPRDLSAYVRGRMLAVFPQLDDAAIDHAWGGTLAITMSRLPHFARVAPNILSASGYSGHGVAMATLAGKAMAEAATGNPARFDIMASHPPGAFPGGPRISQALLALAMIWYGLRDRI